MNLVLFVVMAIWVVFVFRSTDFKPPAVETECVMNIPVWYTSKRLNKKIYGGFTADMGWILMVARYSYSTGYEFGFPDHWGHGNQSWTDMFVQPSDCSTRRFIDAKNNQIERQKIKFKDYYTGSLLYETHPNRRIHKKFKLENMSDKNDLVTMRTIFKHIFKLNKRTREIVDTMKSEYFNGQPYVSMHIRWGDKVGRGDPRDPQESTMIPLETYVEQIPYWLRDKPIYVATDDYTSVEKLRGMVSVPVYTSTRPETRGFSITNYKANLTNTIGMWADLELMAESQFFIGNFESNVARTVLLMRNDPRFNVMDVMSVHRGKRQWSCCDHSKYSNCFWFCEK